MGRGQTSRQTNKNASQQCGAFGAENETRTRDPDLGNREKGHNKGVKGRFYGVGKAL